MRSVLFSMLLFLAACSEGVTLGPTEDGPRDIAYPIKRCMNLGSALDSPGEEGEWGYYIQRNNIKMLKEAGFDTLRIPMRWTSRVSQEPPYEIDPSYFARVDEVVGWATLADMNVIINVHHYTGMMRDPEAQKDRFIAIWDQIADHFALAPPSVMFELLNEPNGNMTVEKNNEFSQLLVDRIRKTHPDRWIIVSGALWGSLRGMEQVVLKDDPRLVLTYHDYHPFDFTHQGIDWTDDPPPTGKEWGSEEDLLVLEQRLDRALAVQETTRMPVFIGEFGVFRDVPAEQRAAWTEGLRRASEARKIGWCYFDFATTFKAYDRQADGWIGPIKEALLSE